MNWENQLNNPTLAVEDRSDFTGTEITSYGLDLTASEKMTPELDSAPSFAQEPLSVLSPESTQATELVFIDSGVEDIESLTPHISTWAKLIM